MQYLTKEKHITLSTHDKQTGVISHTINMLGAAHKGIINPTLGQWLISLLCLHQLMKGPFNHGANKEIMLKGQDLNKIGSSSNPFLWHTQNCIPSWFNSVRLSQCTYIQCSHRTPDGTTKTSTVITIPIIEALNRGLHHTEVKGPWPHQSWRLSIRWWGYPSC